MKNLRYLIVSLIIMFGSAGLIAEEEDAGKTSLDEVVQELADAGKKIKTLQAKGRMSTNVQGMAMEMLVSIWYKAPDKLRFEMQSMSINIKTTVVRKGQTVWMENQSPMGKQAIKMDLSQMAAEAEGKASIMGAGIGALGDPGLIFSEQYEQLKDIYDFEFLGKQKRFGDEDEVYVFTGTATDQAAAGTSLNYWVGVEDGVVRIFELSSPQEKAALRFEFTDIDVNPYLSNSRFFYTPPPGVKVIDMADALRTLEGTGAFPPGMGG